MKGSIPKQKKITLKSNGNSALKLSSMDRHALNVEELQNTKSRLKREILQAGWSPYNIIGCVSNSHTDKKKY